MEKGNLDNSAKKWKMTFRESKPANRFPTGSRK
jgi:hypothetical protein